MSIENENSSGDEQPSPDSIAHNAPDSNAQDENENDQGNASGGVNNLADALIGGMSEPSEHVINDYQNEQQEQQSRNAGTTDKRGDSFNPDQHAVDTDGNPKFTQAGYFAKKRGRKQGSTASVLNVSTPQQTIADESILKKNKQRAAGSAAANTLIMLGVVMGGDEWQPIKDEPTGTDEKQHLQGAFGDYFEAKEMDDIPAGVALSIAIIGYAAPRFTMPKTQQRSKNLWQKVKAWYVNRKLKKHGLKVEDDKKREEKKQDKKTD